ncbi:lysosomal-trafficking regulator-like isoform X2 [Haliotis rufescens]|uniref:lysosomal-trafficking regulator-like isoform X2 n=2 Tax=Haliotis rufescens TaxID=6454 RepID=UPI00201E9A3F|nr:lysosomal-trafficking regulator-like isoform X2 [Haliotis rufescens]
MDTGSLLPEIWETYAQLARRRSDKHASQKRHVILDKFLKLHLMVTAGPQGTPRFGNMKNISNQLSQELMNDILLVSNSAQDESDSSQLQHYLLEGRGWKLLHVIHSVGVKTLSNSRDLCNLLLSLLPWAIQFQPSQPPTESIIFKGREQTWMPVQQCFVYTQKLSKLKSFGCQRETCMHPNHPSRHGTETQYHRKRRFTKMSGSVAQEKNSESEEEEVQEDKIKHSRTRRPTRVLLFKSTGVQEDDDSGSDQDLLGAFPDFPSVQESVSSAELTLIIFDLLLDLCILDLSHVAPGKVMSPTMLPHLLHIFSRLCEKESSENASKINWKDRTKLTLQRHLIRLILTASGIIATQQSGVKILMGHNAVSLIMSAISSFADPSSDFCDNIESDHFDLVMDVICGLLLLFETVFASLPFNPSFINCALGILDCFKTNNGFQYIKKLVYSSKMTKIDLGSVQEELLEDPLKNIASLISTLKMVKVNYIHAVKCLKRRHRNCEYQMYLSHHHNILGYPSGLELEQAEAGGDNRHRSWSSNPSKCQIAVLTQLLLDMLAETKSTKLQLQILSTLRHPGICCCMHPKTIIEAVTPLLPSFSPAIRSCSLESLNDILLDQFMGSEELTDKQLPEINLCKLCTFEDKFSMASSARSPEGMGDLSRIIDSGFSSSDRLEAKKLWSLQRWRPLQVFRQFIVSPDESLALITAKHLIVLAIRGNSDLKQELFFKVYQHVVHSALEDSTEIMSLTDTSSDEQLISLGKVPSSIMLYCVSALPYVLQVDKVMNVFVEKEGLSRLNNLLEDSHLRAPVMGVFEALIMIDEQKVREMKTKNAEEVTKLTSEYIRGTVMQIFIDILAKKTCAITAAFQQLHLEKHGSSGSGTDQQDSGSEDDSTFTPLPARHHDIVKDLPLLQDMWQTCAKLCMNSPTFRSFYRNSPCLYIVQETLLLTLELLDDMGGELCQSRSSVTETSSVRSFSCHLKKLTFIEAVMIVCFSCHTVSPNQKKGGEEAHWKQLRDSLQQCVKLDPTKLKAVFDMLLNTALPQLPSILEYSYDQIIAMLNLKDKEMVDEDEYRELLHFGGSEEEEAVWTEHGYEADTETTMHNDWKKSLQTSHDNRLKHADTICFPSVFRLFVELAITTYNSAAVSKVVLSVLLRLLQMLRSSPPAVLGMCSEGILEVLLDGFKDSLTKSIVDQQELALREILLSLIQLLAQTEIAANELRLYIRLFLVEGFPADSILSTLMSVVENSQVEPCYTVTFPTSRTQQPAPPDTEESEDLFPQYVWSKTAMQCDIKDSITWPPVTSGFSVSWWMNVADVTDDPLMHLPKLRKDHSSSLVFNSINFNGECKSEGSQKNLSNYPVCECLHVLSVGNVEKMFEVWIDVRTRSFVFRITSGSIETEVMKESSSDGVISPGMWHHLVVSYEEKLNGSTLVGKTLLVIDGCMSREIILDYPANFSRKPTSSQPMLLVGHVKEMPADMGHWRLGNMMVFKTASLSREWWFHHYSLGPNLTSVSKCDCTDMNSIYVPYLTKDVLCQADLSLDVLVGATTLSDMEKARTSAVLTYSAQTPTCLSQYCFNSLHEMLTNLGLVHPTASQDPLLFQNPTTIKWTELGRLQNQSHQTLEKAVEQVGGVQTFVFMVAKIYEGCKDVSDPAEQRRVEKLQSKILRLLFSLVHHLPQMALEFHNIQGYAMLRKVLITSRSIVGYEVLKALLDSCTSESLFRPDASACIPILRLGTEAVVRDISILQQLLLSWRVWEKAEEGVLELLFQSLQTLIRPDHQHRDVNIKQFRAGGIMNKIFYIYLERIQEGLPSMTPVVGQAVSAIVEGMLGFPPDPVMLVAVTDFLLLVHPAASTFVVHATSSHFLRCWWANTSAKTTPVTKVTVRSRSVKKSVSGSEGQSEDARSRTDDGSSNAESLGDQEGSALRESESSQGKEDLPVPPSPNLSTSESTDFPPLHPSPSIRSTPGFSHSQSGNESLRGQERERTHTLKEAFVTDTESTSSDSRGGNGYEGSEESERQGEITGTGQKAVSKDYEGSAVSDESQQTSSLLSAAEGEKDEDEEDGHMEFDEDEKDMGDRDVGLVTLCANLLNYLCDLMGRLPESSADRVYDKVLNSGSLIVLAQNSSPQIREAVIRLIGMYTVMAPQQHLENFLKMDGFSLLANQIHQYPARKEHIEAAVSILLEQSFTFDDELDEEIMELSSVQQSSVVLLLSLIEQTAYDLPLCHNTLSLLEVLLVQCPMLSTILLEQGLMEVLTNLITIINRQNSKPTDVVEAENNLLLLDVRRVLCSLAVREFSWSGMTHYQQVEDMFNLLKALEDKEQASEDSKRRCQNLRDLQYVMVILIIEYVERRSEDISQQPHNWFTMSGGSTSSAGSYGSYSDPSSAHLYSLLPASDSSFTSSLRSQLPRGRQPTRKQTPSSRSSDQFADQPFDEKSPSTKTGLAGSTAGDFLDSYKASQTGKSRDMPQRKAANQSRIAQFFGKRKKLMFVAVNQSELLDRFKKFLVFAVDLIVLIEREEMVKTSGERIEMFFTKTTSLEDNFLTKLFNITYRGLEFTLDKGGTSRKSRNVIMWGAKDVIRQQFGRLLLCMLSSKMDFNMRLYGLSFIMGETKGRDVIKMLISTQQLGQELSCYLYNLLTTWRDWLVGTQREQGCILLNLLRQSGFVVYMTDRKLTPQQQDVLDEEKRSIDLRLANAQQLWSQKKQTAADRVLQRYEKHMKLVSDQAMTVTQTVTQLQNNQRKVLVDHIKKSMTEQIQLKKAWQELVQILTHERAVWYHPASYPQSWQLDPTEGPGRMRKRFQRCHLAIDKKYLAEGYKQKLDVENVDPPLIYLFEDDDKMSDSAALLYRLHTNEKIQHTCLCTAISPASENKGELLVGEMSIFFVADEAITDANYTQVLLGNREQLSMTWPHADIKELHKRWFQLNDVGLEIFLTNGRTFLLAFKTTRIRDELYQHLLQAVELPNLLPPSENLATVQRLWLDGALTNFDYLTYLNKISGRSFNDLMQYPIFPFILRDYESDELNLDDPTVYRDLAKPIAVQVKGREAKYKENFEFLCQEYEKPSSLNDYIRIRPYHYGSHYSNSGTVLHYLVRLPPFTKMFLSYQDRNFDIPDRTFHSIATSWRLSSFESTSDVKELIPEFYFLPEFLKNGEGYNFGKRQNGNVVWDVTLPPWARGDSRLFVMVLRQALESPYVTRRIHQWIDLVFGYKQMGEEAIKAINVFHPSTYFGVDMSDITDPLKRQAVLTMIKTYGQTPKQLFRSPHRQCVVTGTTPATPLLADPHLAGREVKHLSYIRRPISNINGLRWGNFVGSPEGGTPVTVWRKVYPVVITTLVPLPTGYVFGLEADSCALVLHAKDRADLVVNSTDVMWAGIISWGHPDRILRVRNQFNRPMVNFLPDNPYDEISCCASVPDCRLLFTAGSAGIVNVYHVTYNRSKASNLQVFNTRTALYGHTGPVNVLYVCKSYSVLVSGSEDGTCIIWDLNRLSYVRSISSHNASVKTLAVSDTMGDIASVSPRALGSFLQLHTINGQFVASRKCDEFTINCVAFSRAPEGRAINVIAGGLSTGVVRLWSSWDLTVLRDLSHEHSIARPVVSVIFTHDSQRLFASALDGSVTLWEKPSQSKPKPENFIAFVEKTT